MRQCCGRTAWAGILTLRGCTGRCADQAVEWLQGKTGMCGPLAWLKAKREAAAVWTAGQQAWTSLLRLGSRICHPVLRDCMSASSCPTTPCSVPYSTSLRPEFRGERSCESAMKRTTVTALSVAACSSAEEGQSIRRRRASSEPQ